jgi:hypothetical protein
MCAVPLNRLIFKVIGRTLFHTVNEERFMCLKASEVSGPVGTHICRPGAVLTPDSEFPKIKKGPIPKVLCCRIRYVAVKDDTVSAVLFRMVESKVSVFNQYVIGHVRFVDEPGDS